MKHLLHFILFFCLFSCKSRGNNNQAETTSSVAVEDTATPAATAKLDSSFLIVPGERIGQARLGMTAKELNSKLGKPDSGNAAMGKALSFWVSEDKGPRAYVAAYIVNNFDGSGSPSKVQQAQVTSQDFQTTSGIGVGTPLPEIRKQFTRLEPLGYYSNQENQQVYVYDDKAQGIAFEVTTADSICTAITIHNKGEDVTETYLPTHPDMAPLE